MSELIQYKCPCCGGAVEFNSTAQKMKCPYCDTEFDLDTLKAYEEQLSEEEERKTASTEWKTNAGSQWQEGETAGMNVYTCKSCGGYVHVITTADEQALIAEADSYVTVPRTEECLQNFLCAIPAQLLGYRLSEERERIARAEARK